MALEGIALKDATPETCEKIKALMNINLRNQEMAPIGYQATSSFRNQFYNTFIMRVNH
jgi:hypothetical protein